MLYFDHNATTPLDPQVAERYRKALCDYFGNASSVHRTGQAARNELERARRSIASALGITGPEIVFTSGGTEADNLAIRGCIAGIGAGPKHVITSAIEHPAVLETVRQLAREGIDASYAPVDSSGIVSPDSIAGLIRPETVLVSVMHANNETGVVQPMEAIAEIVRARRARGQAIYFHSDGVQAFGKIAPQAPAADLYSISAHKIYGPKGIGALLARKNVPLNNIQFGGRHERGRRPGTENVAGAIAFAKAVELCDASDRDHLSGLRNRFESQVLSAVSEVTINGIRAPRVPNTSNITFEGVPAEALLIALDLKGMAVSTGSACASGAVEPSHVLLAMRLSRESAASSLRFSFGRFNSVEDVDRLGEEVIRAVRQLRTSRVSEAILV